VAQPLNGANLRIGIVQARFNAGVTGELLAACMTELHALGVSNDLITHVTVPGALEVPWALQALARQGKSCIDGVWEPHIRGVEQHALIALGCVIRGETYHFELVANESAAGITRVALEYHVPIANAILTTENLVQARARQVEKGRDAARVAVEMALLPKHLTQAQAAVQQAVQEHDAARRAAEMAQRPKKSFF
jgi:6,7-dimethyl-8-ribityllumazine synthase